jgi:hypothetical protein
MTKRTRKMEETAPAASPSKPPARRGHAAHSTRPRKAKAETAAAASEPAVAADAPPRKTPVRSPRTRKAPSAATAAVPGAAQNVPPTLPEFRIDHEAIAALAYSYWEERGRTGGSPQEDWYRAEQELYRMREMYLRQAS